MSPPNADRRPDLGAPTETLNKTADERSDRDQATATVGLFRADGYPIADLRYGYVGKPERWIAHYPKRAA